LAAAEDQHRDRLFGRRVGRPLRPAQQDALGTLLPALRLDRPDDPAAGFPRPGPLLLEIGFGSGEHFCALLRARPDANLIGSDVFLNGLASLLTRLLREEAEAPFRDRVRLWPDDARGLLARLPDASLDGVFLLFPDPWPKARHAERRLFAPAFLARMALLLKPGAVLTVATDHPIYRAWVEEVLAAAPAWRVLSREDRAVTDAPRTRFEARAFREGRASTWWALGRQARKAPSPCPSP
jgi:tRNA (guanine-N7-)-methyltransferase